jgi:hypothetical protein
MAPIAAELEGVLQKYKSEVQPAVALTAPQSYGLGVLVDLRMIDVT